MIEQHATGYENSANYDLSTSYFAVWGIGGKGT